ncbi:TonB-dependent receptor [Sphingomonas sp. DG1-23]|uniref:TonB-dependent receptor n=1 Tax=Sphingomonas sp. DG1-23 TaxID=3068316 RepID=UPI00273E5E1F|nr:TonB-dependent receptor [Sphingomonas sp. DG1-23]MDP5281279.1 TonB-dependent receptor [Sphingomonas sp. DG1-23]
MPTRWLMGSVAMIAAAQASAQEASPEQEQVATPADEAGASPDIVVVGTRASDRSAQDTKRESDQIVDSVVAEDIGALPDFNVAEALQRVPGIALDRNEFTGEGSGVSVRGLNQITTSLAGRSIFSGVGRSLNLGEVPAGLVGRVDVYKSPQADQIEAGLGGTVDVKLRSPADLKKFTASVTARGIYRRLSDSFNPSFSAMVGNNWNVGDGKLGVLISGIYDRRNFRTDRLAVDAFADRRNLVDRDGDGRATNNPADSIYVPTTLTTRYSLGEFERWALGGRLQYKSPGYEFYVDGIYNSYKGTQDHSFIAARLNQTLYGARAALQSYTVRPDNLTFESGTFRNVPFQSTTYIQDEKNSVWQAAAGFKIHSGKLQATGDVSLLRSTKNEMRRDLTTGGIAPTFLMDLRPDTPSYDYQGVDLLDPRAYRPDRISTYNYPNEGEERAARLDITANLDLPVLQAVQWGVRYTRRTADRIGFDEGVSLTGRTPTTPLADTLNATPDDLFANRFDLIDTTWLRPNPAVVREFAGLVRAYGLPAGFPALEPLLAYSFDEKTQAAYAMARIRQEIGSMRLTGNAGVRIVNTRQNANGYRTAATTGTFEPVDIDRKYSAVLPSINLALRITPDLVVRAAYSEVMSKPSFLDLSPTRTLDYETFEGSGGNPELMPYQANQYDAAIEYYFGRPGFVYLGYFRKDIDGYYQRVSRPEIIDGQTFQIEQLVNADAAKVDGWEVGYQQQYDFLPGALRGLGGRFSYTRINSNRYNSTLRRNEPLSGLSPNLYNATLTYELGGFRARLAYNWRESYPINLNPGGALNLPQTRRSFGIWDASATWQLRKNVALFVDISNITNQRGTEVFTVRERPRSFFLSDQTIGLGIRANF